MSYQVLTGVLQARTAVHIGSGAGNAVADALLRRDVQGKILIPGTAIAGALRALLTRLAPRLGATPCIALWPEDARRARTQKGCGCAVCRLLGDVDPNDEGGHTAASRLLVFNARLLEGSLPVVRDGVGIDRQTGAAARATGAKFALETLPVGARFELRMELREPLTADASLDEDERLLAAALAEWRAGRLYLGGNVGRGLGAFDLLEDELHYYERDLDTPDGLLAFLRADEPWQPTAAQQLQDVTPRLWKHLPEIEITPAPKVRKLALGTVQKRVEPKNWENLNQSGPLRFPFARGWAEWNFTLQAEGPLLTHDPTTAGLSGFAHAPLLARLGDWQHPVLPGSGLRGVLRSHAERIARTLSTYQALATPDPEGYFKASCPACDPSHRRPHAAQHTGVLLESCDSLLRHQQGADENKEIPAENLCLACQLFGSPRNGSRFHVEDAAFVGDKPVYKIQDFLAVDRFTGGGAEHLKFDALVLWKPAFQVRLFLESPEPWELGWLTLVLRDLAEGWLRVGFGAAKGFGKVAVTEGTFQQATLPSGKPPEGAESVFTIESLALGDAELQERQRAWLAEFHDKLGQLKEYRRAHDMTLPADSYFGAQAAELYRLDVGQQGGTA